MAPSNVEIRDMGFLRIKHEALRFRGSYTKVGLPNGEPVVGGTRKPADNVMIGAIHEFGAPKANIPERSWLRSAFDKEQNRINTLIASSYESVLAGRSTARQALSKLGEWFTARVKANFPPEGVPGYAESTLKQKRRKGETNPQLLIETGQLRNSVTHKEVVRG